MTKRLLALLTTVTLVVPTVTARTSAAADNRTIVVAPGQSIQHAIHRLPHGGVVELRGGRYHQRVRLVDVHGLTLRPYRDEHPVLDGTGLTPGRDDSGMVTIARSTHVTVRGLEITGYRTKRLNHVPIGIYVRSHDRYVHILDNHVHALGNYNKTLGSFDINAHGIAVYGDDPHSAVRNLTIRGNVVDHLHLGASESVVVNGNVDHWTIASNRIHDDNNIGIDAIGFEPTLSGKYRYTQRNRARHGVIENNVVARIKSKGNPAYWDDGWCNCADGIYVDGGTRILIRHNHVTRSDIGIEVAAENRHGSADHVVVAHNHITGSLFTGITTGGYCNGAADCGGVQTGRSHDNVFRYNTLRNNNRLDDGSPELLVQYHAHRDTFVHNTITATNHGHVVYGTVPDSDSTHNRSDHNRFAGGSPSTAGFGWQNHTYTGFGNYRAGTGQDAHSRFA